MGSQNVIAMMSRASGLSRNAMLVAWYMAQSAFDQPGKRHPPRVYVKGWQKIADVMFADRSPAAAERAVARGIAELIERGLIKPLHTSAKGKTQHYELLI